MLHNHEYHTQIHIMSTVRPTLTRRRRLTAGLRYPLNYAKIHKRMQRPRTHTRSRGTTLLRIPSNTAQSMKFDSLPRNSNYLGPNLSTNFLRRILRNRAIRSHTRRTRMINTNPIRAILKRLHTTRMITTASRSDRLPAIQSRFNSLLHSQYSSIKVSA